MKDRFAASRALAIGVILFGIAVVSLVVLVPAARGWAWMMVGVLGVAVSPERLQKLRARVDELRAAFASYDGGDRPMSPPASLICELTDAERELEEALPKTIDVARKEDPMFAPGSEQHLALARRTAQNLADALGVPHEVRGRDGTERFEPSPIAAEMAADKARERDQERELARIEAEEDDDRLLDPSTPEAEVDAALRASGLDPEEVGARGLAFYKQLQAAQTIAEVREAEQPDRAYLALAEAVMFGPPREVAQQPRDVDLDEALRVARETPTLTELWSTEEAGDFGETEAGCNLCEHATILAELVEQLVPAVQTERREREELQEDLDDARKTIDAQAVEVERLDRRATAATNIAESWRVDLNAARAEIARLRAIAFTPPTLRAPGQQVVRCVSVQTALDVGLNGFAYQLVGESFVAAADRNPQKLPIVVHVERLGVEIEVEARYAASAGGGAR